MNRRVVILTKSDKHNGFCVAGRDVDSGEWVRLENSRGVIDSEDLTTKDGYECRELDIIEVELLSEESDVEHQPENVLIDEQSYVKLLGEMTWPDIINKWGCDCTNTILGITQRPRGAYPGKPSIKIENRLNFYNSNNIKHKSLSFIKVYNASFEINEFNGERKNHPKIKFQYKNSKGDLLNYYLTVTDPDFPNDENLPKNEIPELFLIVRLGDVYEEDGEVYLLAAKVIID